MNSLQRITTIAALSATLLACKQPAPPEEVTIYAVPKGSVERSQASYSTWGSYTFPFTDQNGREKCAYRWGATLVKERRNLSQDTVNRMLEYEAMRINQAYKSGKMVTFTTSKGLHHTFGPESCIDIENWSGNSLE